MNHRIIFSVALALMLAGCTSQPAPLAEQQAATPSAAAPAPAPSPVSPVTPPKTDAEIIASATSAAPEAVSMNATIIALDEKMQVRTVRKGTNLWTCIPDGPSPGVDPMCVDKNGLEWVNAWIQHKDPPADKMGFAYMLMGGSDASNDDPFATAPAAGHTWVDTGPHVMLLNIGNRFEGYPTTHDDPKQPYVMWPITPYRHLMIPVQ